MTTKSGPGKSYRKGLTLKAVAEMFSTEEKAEAWFVAQRWPDGVTCPFCQSKEVSPRPTRKPQPFRCRTCRKDFSVKTKTVLHSSKISLSNWAIGFYLFMTNLKGVSSMRLYRELGISQKAAWHMAHRIREALDDTGGKFAGPVEADETYVGGKESNRHESKKLRAGRGTAGKTPVVGVIDRETNQIRTEVVERTDKGTLQDFVVRHTEDDATVYTDEAVAYRGLPRYHEAVAHGAGEYVRGMAHTNGLESHWALFDRGIVGVYHWVSVKHLHRYSGEFEGRHNDRPLDTVDQMAGLVRSGEGRQLRYRDLVA